MAPTATAHLAGAIGSLLHDVELGRPLYAYGEIGSTSDLLKDLAAAGATEGTAVIALGQSRGRGRRERVWHSPPGRGLYLSVLLRPDWPAAEAGWLAVLGGLAVAQALERHGVAGVAIKHPNDVMAGGRKIAGILIEPRLGGGRIEHAVVGIGVNLAQDEGDWRGTPLEGRATSCAAAGRPWPLEQAAAAVLRELDLVYRGAETGRRAQLLEEWVRRGGRREVPGIT